MQIINLLKFKGICSAIRPVETVLFCGHFFNLQTTKHLNINRAPDNFQVQRVITPYFWIWWVFAYFLYTVVLSTSEKIAYMYTFKIMFDTSVIQ
jgi:hypothetical protein